MTKRSHIQARGEEFHLMVGTCITAWADVDEALFQIFWRCVGPLKQCAIIYYKTPSMNARLTMTSEIVKSRLPLPKQENGGKPHPDVAAWSKAAAGFESLLSARRRIAHQPSAMRVPPHAAFVGHAFAGAIYASGDDEYFEIYTSLAEQLRGKEAERSPLKIADLEKHLADVTALRDRLVRYLNGPLAPYLVPDP